MNWTREPSRPTARFAGVVIALAAVGAGVATAALRESPNTVKGVTVQGAPDGSAKTVLEQYVRALRERDLSLLQRLAVAGNHVDARTLALSADAEGRVRIVIDTEETISTSSYPVRIAFSDGKTQNLGIERGDQGDWRLVIGRGPVTQPGASAVGP